MAWYTPSLMAPLPDDGDFASLRSELEFIQRELLRLNAALPERHQSTVKSITVPEWSDFDDGLSRLISFREKLIKKREIWTNLFMASLLARKSKINTKPAWYL